MHSPLRLVQPPAGFSAAVLLLALSACSTPENASPAAAPPPPVIATPAPAVAAPPELPTPRSPIEDSVVKITATVRLPNPLRPWEKGPPTPYHGTGVVIAGHRILATLHGTEYASDIQVQGNGGGDPLPATVVCLASNGSLALLEVADDSFFLKHPPLPLAAHLPAVRDAVTIYGYPIASPTVSVSRTIISSIEFKPYNPVFSGLVLRSTANVDNGELGAPAVIDGAVAGLVFVRHAESGQAVEVGIVPAEEIALFLHGIAHGRYGGKPAVYDEFQKLNNPALRAFLKLAPDVHGVVVDNPYDDAADYPLKKWDVVTRIGDTPIDDQGMITVGGGLHVYFTYLVQTLAHDGRLPLTIVRDGQTQAIALPVANDRPLVEPPLDGAYPSYFIYGPVVFSAANQRFLITIRRSAMIVDLVSALHSPLYTRQFDRPRFPGEQLVIVSSPFFSDHLTLGYNNPEGGVVQDVDGIPIKNLLHLVQVLREAQGDYITINFAARGSESLVFPRKEMAAATARILDANSVRAQGSPDAMAVWQGGAAP